MRRRTPARAAEEAVYRRESRLWLLAHPDCEYPGCDAASTEVHHAAGRRGADLNAQEWWRALCHTDHRRVTEYPVEALELGLSVSRVGLR